MACAMMFRASSLCASLSTLPGELVLWLGGDWDLRLVLPVCSWYIDFFPKDFYFNSSPTNQRLFMAAWCICSCGSPGSGCVVNRYACAATRAASGVSCMKSSSSSDNGVLMLLARSFFLGYAVLLLLCFGSRCLSSLEPDISLCSSSYDLLDALLFSRLLFNALFFFWQLLFVLVDTSQTYL
jgi:hypothetical protein